MKQLIIVADMEGASGIFDSNREACWHEELHPQNTLWRSYGREYPAFPRAASCAYSQIPLDEEWWYRHQSTVHKNEYINISGHRYTRCLFVCFGAFGYDRCLQALRSLVRLPKNEAHRQTPKEARHLHKNG